MAIGYLRIETYAARLSAPIPEVTVFVTSNGTTQRIVTDSTGNAEPLPFETPSRTYSLEEENDTVLPYHRVSLHAEKEGYRDIDISGIEIFDCETTLARLELIPDTSAGESISDVPVVIPESVLFTGGGGSGPAPDEPCAQNPRILNEVIIPESITVHLGRPAASASNVTVSFRHYIANVASSEVYPTWPEQALRANIHAQISLALNRIWTEWYPSRGYSFNITNSTSYDQYFVYNRTIFDVMETLTDDIFNTYLRRPGTVNPYYSEYCDGKTVTCNGLKQWGTVTLANEGRNALQILRYYYGSNLDIIRTNNIAAIEGSYPGTPIREGDTGPYVSLLQQQLNRITKDYPAFGKLTVDGIFSAAMTRTVKAFQKQFSLTQDGVVGRNTWYKISYIYVSVKKLAQLTSEGETGEGILPGGTWGGTTLRRGDTGSAVETLQFWLNSLSSFYTDLAPVAVDGSFGAATEAAVRAFQQKFGLTVDGVVGESTWTVLYAEYQSIASDSTGINYPGTPLRRGDTGELVKLVQFWLRFAAYHYNDLDMVSVDGVFGNGTYNAVVQFQNLFGLTADGIVGRNTWDKMKEVYLDVSNDLLNNNQLPGEFPGTLRRGSTGNNVRALQYYLYVVSIYEGSVPAPAIDGVFGSGTQNSVEAYQRYAGLTVDGVVGRNTWNTLYNEVRILVSNGEVVRVLTMDYPGTPLRVGSTGTAVVYFSILLERIGYYYDEVPSLEATDTFDTALEGAVEDFQRLMHLPETGIVDAATWRSAEQLSLELLSAAPDSDILAEGDEYPGYVVQEGSAGAAVRRVQGWLNDVATGTCDFPFVEEDGSFGPRTCAALEAFKERNCMTGGGSTVGREIWAMLRPDEEE